MKSSRFLIQISITFVINLLSNRAIRGFLSELASMYSINFFKSSHAVTSEIWIALNFFLSRVWQIPEEHFIYVLQFALNLNKWTNRTCSFVRTENCSTVCFGEGNAKTSTDTAVIVLNIFSPINVSLVLVWQLSPEWWLLMSGLEHSVKCWNLCKN